MTKAKGNIWKGIIMLVLGTVFMLPVFLIVMNSFKTGKEILTNFVSFPTSLYQPVLKHAHSYQLPENAEYLLKMHWQSWQ